MNALEFRNIIERSTGVMYRVALALTGNEADAADAVQDACLKLWEKRTMLARAENKGAYCTGAARHAALDIIRGRHPSADLGHLPEPATGEPTRGNHDARSRRPPDG